MKATIALSLSLSLGWGLWWFSPALQWSAPCCSLRLLFRLLFSSVSGMRGRCGSHSLYLWKHRTSIYEQNSTKGYAGRLVFFMVSFRLIWMFTVACGCGMKWCAREGYGRISSSRCNIKPAATITYMMIVVLLMTSFSALFQKLKSLLH